MMFCLRRNLRELASWSDAAHERQRHALELVVLDKLVQVDAQEFESYAHVVPEIEIVAHIDNGGSPVGIVVSEVFE